MRSADDAVERGARVKKRQRWRGGFARKGDVEEDEHTREAEPLGKVECRYARVDGTALVKSALAVEDPAYGPLFCAPRSSKTSRKT